MGEAPWPVMRLGELLSVAHGWPFKSAGYAEDDRERPVVLSIGNFNYEGGGFRFGSSAVKTYDGEYPAEYETSPGDIMLVMTCQTAGGEILGVPARVPDDGRVYLHNQRIGRVVIDDRRRLDSDYFYHWAKTSTFNRQLYTTASGTKILHTSPGRIGAALISLPALGEQRAIAEVLGALDDKIAANEGLVSTIDSLAEALTSTSLGGETAALQEIALLTMGSSPPGSSYNDVAAGVAFYQGVRDFGTRFPTNRVWTTEPVRTAASGDTLLSVRAPVGRTNLANEELCLGRGLAGLHSRVGAPMTLFHQVRAAHAAWAPYEAEGTVFGSINKKQLESIMLPMIMPDRAESLEIELASLEACIASSLGENVLLATTRDELLPLLMSGKVRVKDAEKIVEEVV